MKAALITMVSALALVGCGAPNQTNNSAMMDNAADPLATDMAMDNGVMDNAVANDATTAAPMTAQQFANTAAASDAYEIASSKLATEKAQAAELKSFAQQMVKDHTASTAKLKSAAGSIKPDPTMNPEQQANIDALEAASGAAFDTAYRTQQLAAHQKALTALQGYAAAGDNEALKTFASETAPIVQGHLTMLQGM
jgi:putative membrane protein